MSFQDLCFKSIPNFKFQEHVSTKSDGLSGSYNFDCYKDKKGEVILITPYFDIDKVYELDFHICFINLETNQIVHTLGDKNSEQPQNKRVMSVRYFNNPYDKNDYFISSDMAQKIKVWNLGETPKDSKKIFEIEINYSDLIYSCLLIFEPKKMFAVTSSIGYNNHTKVYDIETNDCKELNSSNSLEVYYLDYWFNKNENDKNKQHVIIQGAKKKVIFTEYPSDTLYYSVDTGDEYPYIQSGLAFKQKNKDGNERDLFAFSATYGLVQVIDISKKQEVKKIEMTTGEVHLYSFIKWNDQYLLLNDCQQSSIIIFDMFNDFKEESKNIFSEMGFDKFMRKIVHPVYGESILSCGVDWKIKLFVKRNCFFYKK